MIELLARTLYEAPAPAGRQTMNAWDNAGDFIRAHFRGLAKLVLETLRDQPTETMISILGRRALCADDTTEGWRAALDEALRS